MSRLAFMFQVLKTMYREETLDVSYLYNSSNPHKAGGPSSLIYMVIPSVYTPSETYLLLSNFSFSGLGMQLSSGVVNISLPFASSAASAL